jgi:GntR family transcriptional regulator
MNSKEMILAARVSIDTEIPLYYQLISIIKRNISAGVLNPGDAIPSETEFCEALQISRSTVRQAIGQLESEGLVVRRRGKGSFISVPKLNRSMDDVYSFSREMKAMGLVPTSIVHAFEKTQPTDVIAKALKLTDPDQHIFKIVRIRCANDEPLMLETTLIPEHIIPNLTRNALETGSLYTILRERAGRIPYEAEETYETTNIDEKMASILKCRVGISAFYVERRTWSNFGELCELTQSIIRGDRTKFVLKLKSGSVSWDRNYFK